MEEISEIYHQSANREYLSTTLGKEMWVQVSGHRMMNSSDAGFWAAFIPVEEVEEVFRNVEWDNRVGTQGPGFIESGEKVYYERLNTNFESCENIVHYRKFFGIKPDYVELVEEFRLLNNLYHDTATNMYYAISENGECLEVAKIENRTCAYIKLQYLTRYASARQMALLLFFDMRTSISGSLSHNGLKEFSDSSKDNTLFYEIWGAESDTAPKNSYSVLMGKKIIYPKPVDECGYWPYEKGQQYEEFIIGIDDQGNPRKFTCDPSKLSNYFGKNPGAPLYQTPVFFKKEVLQRYFSHPNLFVVEDGYLRCQSLWGMEIDNHHMDYVSVYLGDLGRDLPAQERNHWLQYNIATAEKISKVAFQRDFLNIPAESNMADLKFKASYYRFQSKWNKKYGWDLFLPLTQNDQYNIELLHIPITSSQEEFDHQVLSLVKTLIDSLNEKEVKKQLNSAADIKGSISLLEQWLIEMKFTGFEPHIEFLRKLQKLRSTGTGHRKGKDYEKIKSEFGLTEDNFCNVFSDILDNANSFIDFLENAFLYDGADT